LTEEKLQNEELNQPTLLTEEEVFDVLAFAREMAGSSLFGNSALTPMLLNQRMKDIALNPMQATEATLTDAINNPKDSEQILQAFSQDFEIQSQVYKKLLAYLGNMLSFDLTYYCFNAEPKDYKSTPYKKDLKIVKDFLNKFDYKSEFTAVVKGLLRNETFFGLPRFEGDSRIVLQQLPASPNYTMITGRWEYGFLFSMNMYWFMQPGVEIKMYPKFFRDKLNELFGDDKKYKPALMPELRGGSSWVYWQDIPTDVGFCWKMTPEIAARVPYFSGLFLDLIQQPTMRLLQKDINMSTAARILFGEIGTLKDPVAKGKNQFNISHDRLGQFLALVKSAIGDSIKVAGAPMENMQGISFPSETGVYESYLKTALATSGVNTNLIFTSDVRPNSLESQLSLNVDEQMMYSLYPQFSGFLEYHINKLTKNFKFKFDFEGTEFYNNRKERLEKAMTLADKGIVLPQKIAAAVGMTQQSFQQQMEEAKAMGWVDTLIPIVSGFQVSKEDAGRPQKDESELSDSGEETRSAGSNIEKDGKI